MTPAQQARLDMRRTPGNKGSGPDSYEEGSELKRAEARSTLAGTFNFETDGFFRKSEDDACRVANEKPSNLLDHPKHDGVEFAWCEETKQTMCRSGFGDWVPVKGSLS